MSEIPLDNLEIYGFCDPAAGKAGRLKKRRARQAIIVAARDWLNRWFELYSWAGHLTPTQLLDKILDVYDKWRPRNFRIEANGMQVLFGSLVRDAAIARFGQIKILPAYQPTKVEKTFRIRTGLEPIINQGRLFLLSKTSDLATEIRGFPTAATKDLVDSLESVIRFAPKRAEASFEDEKIEDYAKYLRSTGCPGYLIEQKLLEFKKKGNFHHATRQ